MPFRSHCLAWVGSRKCSGENPTFGSLLYAAAAGTLRAPSNSFWAADCAVGAGRVTFVPHAPLEGPRPALIPDDGEADDPPAPAFQAISSRRRRMLQEPRCGPVRNPIAGLVIRAEIINVLSGAIRPLNFYAPAAAILERHRLEHWRGVFCGHRRCLRKERPPADCPSAEGLSCRTSRRPLRLGAGAPSSCAALVSEILTRAPGGMAGGWNSPQTARILHAYARRFALRSACRCRLAASR